MIPLLNSLPIAYNGSYGPGPWMLLMMIPMALLCVAMMLRHMQHGGRHHHVGRRNGTALAILERRFAEGDLSPDEYHERRDLLTAATTPRPGHRDPKAATEGA